MSIAETDLDVPTITFAAGIPGFPEARQFALVWWGDEDGPFSILTCVDEPALEFLVVPPASFFSDYVFELDDDTAERLGIESVDDAIVVVIVTVGDDATAATANLLAPVVINRHTRQAAQVVLTEGELPLRAPLFG
jgi:flagellar assembly factor FliW